MCTHPKTINRLIKKELFPPHFTCHCCNKEIFKGEFCEPCNKSIFLNDGTHCPVCGRKTAKSEICIECKAHAPAFKRAISAYVYEGNLPALILKFKNGGTYLGELFAQKLAPKIKELPPCDGLIYVPATKKSLRRRGYNQSQVLAERLSALTDIPVMHGAVHKVKDTPEQKQLGRGDRANNLAGCFKAKGKIVKDKTVLIVDDVITTGATLDSMAKSLKKAGAHAVFAVTAASVKFKIAR